MKTPEQHPQWTAEEKAEIIREVTRPTLLELEVHWRTWEAAKANPGSVRIIVTDKEGNKVIERPFRPRNVGWEADADRTDFKRHMIRRAT
jgi:hypothetical protein